MKLAEHQTKDILALARKLPSKRVEEHAKRLEHTKRYGHIVTIEKYGRVTDYAELFRMKHIPSFPVKPWPKDDPDGKYLYCYAAVSKNIRALITIAKNKFKDCHFIVWHRRKKNNKVHLNRIGASYG